MEDAAEQMVAYLGHDDRRRILFSGKFWGN